MAHTPEEIDEGVVRVGTTGTISSLMMRELDQISSTSKPHMLPVSITSGSSNPQKQLHSRKSLDEASSSGSSKNIMNHHRSSRISSKTKLGSRNSHHLPMLGSDYNFPVETSHPIRQKNDKKKSNIVEIVDIKCGNPDKAWASPITNSLKKLSFSKLSESII